MDKIPPEGAEVKTKAMLDTLNGLLDQQSFSGNWKESLVTLIWKGKTEQITSLHGTICLLSTFEKLLKKNAEEYAENSN